MLGLQAAGPKEEPEFARRGLPRGHEGLDGRRGQDRGAAEAGPLAQAEEMQRKREKGRRIREEKRQAMKRRQRQLESDRFTAAV